MQDLLEILRANNCHYRVVGREELHHHHLIERDLVISVGGDGISCPKSHDEKFPYHFRL